MISIVTPTIRYDQGGLEPIEESLSRQTFKDFEWLVEKHDPQQPPDFNAAMNRLIKKAQGELIVSLQDFITIQDDGLDQFWDAYLRYPNSFFTAPVRIAGKYDWRRYRDNYDQCNFMEWEIDWGAAPKEALTNIGGFDEELDKYWGFDNVNVGLRAVQYNYDIRCLPNNVADAVDHNAHIHHPYQKLRNPDFHNERLDDIRHGLVLNYLS